jgi:hypothetical protein
MKYKLFSAIFEFYCFIFNKDLETEWKKLKDNCEECNGNRGGIFGNENIVNGKVLCDYCTSNKI